MMLSICDLLEVGSVSGGGLSERLRRRSPPRRLPCDAGWAGPPAIEFQHARADARQCEQAHEHATDERHPRYQQRQKQGDSKVAEPSDEAAGGLLAQARLQQV